MAMSRLYMSCALCGRKQAHGLLSHAYWGQVEVARASLHRVCPACKEQHRDWEDRVRAAVIEVGAQEASPPGNGIAYR
jgi:hypothetical protein